MVAKLGERKETGNGKGEAVVYHTMVLLENFEVECVRGNLRMMHLLPHLGPILCERDFTTPAVRSLAVNAVSFHLHNEVSQHDSSSAFPYVHSESESGHVGINIRSSSGVKVLATNRVGRRHSCRNSSAAHVRFLSAFPVSRRNDLSQSWTGAVLKF